MAKVAKQRVIDRTQILCSLVQGIAKNLAMSQVDIFEANNLNMTGDSQIVELLSEGILNNESLKVVSFSGCQISDVNLEILLKGVLTHKTLEHLDLSENQLDDRHCNILKRIVNRQTERRDQVKWAFSLRNELPMTNNYTRGLSSIDLSFNNFSDITADELADALRVDNYLRSLNISSNLLREEGCKKLIKAMRTNNTLLSLDLRDNEGYTENVHMRLVMKLSKNLRTMINDPRLSSGEVETLKMHVDKDYFDVYVPTESKIYFNP